MPHGKAAGERCVQLGPDWQCLIFGQPGRPQVCASLMPSVDMCGGHRDQAMATLSRMEADIAPMGMIPVVTRV